MSDGKPSTYAELISVLSALPLLLRETRRARGLSVRAAAREIGCSFATVSRIEAGEDCALSNAVAILWWIATPPGAVAGAVPSPSN
ncbi:helix-turn-helix domain-containing protein [Micromonospora humida]|uniref:helix-turn-helix domain-containing protein n=1 Tax=Micromonospora humida TaxID=2809018 RepID=UPI003672DA65